MISGRVPWTTAIFIRAPSKTHDRIGERAGDDGVALLVEMHRIGVAIARQARQGHEPADGAVFHHPTHACIVVIAPRTRVAREEGMAVGPYRRYLAAVRGANTAQLQSHEALAVILLEEIEIRTVTH